MALSETDGDLVKILGLRIDLPPRFLRDLLKRATDAVRDRLMALAPPELQEEISQVLKAISAAAQESAWDYSRAETLVKHPKIANEFSESAILRAATPTITTVWLIDTIDGVLGPQIPEVRNAEGDELFFCTLHYIRRRAPHYYSRQSGSALSQYA